MSTTKIGVFTDSHEGKSLEAICRLFSQEGVQHTAFMGDGLLQYQAPLTLANSRRASTIKRSLRQNTGLRRDFEAGNFSQEQKNRIDTDFQEGKEISTRIARTQGEQMRARVPKLKFAVGGNHDTIQFAEGLGDAYVNGRTKEVAGKQWYGCPGGGDIPGQTAFIDNDLLADDREFRHFPAEKWIPGLVSKNPTQMVQKIDVLGSHTPLLFDDEMRKDAASVQLTDAFTARAGIAQQYPQLGLTMPKVLLHGHLHNKASSEFKDLQDDDGNIVWNGLVINPGVSSIDHNFGQFSSACIMEQDDDSGEIACMHEYRIWSSMDGLLDVECHATHEFDWENRTINIIPVGKRALYEQSQDAFVNNLEQDPHFSLVAQGFDNNYEGLSTLEKDNKFRQNQALGEWLGNEFSHSMRQAINWTRRVYFEENGLKSGDELTGHDISIMARMVKDIFLEDVASAEGVSFEGIENPAELRMFENAYLQARCNFQPGVISYALRVDNPTVDGVWKDWGRQRGLLKHLQEGTQQVNDELAREGLEDDDYKEMAQLYLPGTHSLTDDLENGEYQQIHSIGLQQGLITTRQVEDMGDLFVRNDSYVPTPISLNQLVDQDDYTGGTSQQYLGPLPESQIRELLGRKEQVLQDERGDFFATREGKHYLDPALKEEFGYSTKTVADAFTDGSYRVIIPREGMNEQEMNQLRDYGRMQEEENEEIPPIPGLNYSEDDNEGGMPF